MAEGERARASDCQGVEAPWPLAFSRKANRQETKNQKMPGDSGATKRTRQGHRYAEGTATGKPPPGADRNPRTGRGRQRGGEHKQDTAADAGTRRRSQGQVVESGGGRVQETSMWTELRARIGGGESVKEKGDTTSNATDGGEVGQRGKEKIQKNRWK